jgi:tetratricopeptide (TPR) repeat protein
MLEARDGDLQADWVKMLDARERFVVLARNEELAPLAHYYAGYADWRLSSLAYVTLGPIVQARLADRAIASLEAAIAKRPQFPDAQALLATCLATRLYTDPHASETLMPRIRAAWQAAWPAGDRNPRVMLLRAMSRTFAPPPYGNPEQGVALWRQAIDTFASDRPEPLLPDWGDVEAVAWLGGALLVTDRPEEATVLLERAVKMRPDFWWAGKAALPMARRPIAGTQ